MVQKAMIYTLSLRSVCVYTYTHEETPRCGGNIWKNCCSIWRSFLQIWYKTKLKFGFLYRIAGKGIFLEIGAKYMVMQLMPIWWEGMPTRGSAITGGPRVKRLNLLSGQKKDKLTERENVWGDSALECTLHHCQLNLDKFHQSSWKHCGLVM